ncbi:MAG: radical SAM family heme chaperone HemW [Candidatus Omnitrophota bacterium]|jgi:oxygen-independent coproporphyrinogen-3 oxidase
MQAVSLYIHIPFCARKCAYCDFYSVKYDGAAAKAYIDVICGQVGKIERPVSTIFIGGGTPTVLGTALLKKLLRSLRRYSGKGAEFTVEANPESLTPDKISLFLDEGVNRISIGVQSFRDGKLAKLGRIHDAKKARNAVLTSKKKGFRNINADLIFGAPGETFAECAAELKEAVGLPVTHLSCYCLSYEKGTPLYKAKADGNAVPVEEESVARMYSYVMDFLPEHGFGHYEVSNFARKGYTCRHNLNYWDNKEYIGLGASAVSYIDGIRKKTLPDVDEYIKRASSGASTTTSSERLAGERKARETAAVKIRTAEGINFRWFKEMTGYDLMELEPDAMRKLKDAGLIKYVKSRGLRSVPAEKICGISLTRRGFLFCDTVSSELL